MTTLFPFLLAAAVAAAAGLWLLEATIRRTTVGVGVILASVVAAGADVPLPTIALGGVAIYVPDLVLAVIATACVARFLRARHLEVAHYWLMALALLVAYSLVRGVAQFGPAAVSEARSWLLPVAAMVYTATALPTPEVLDRVGRLWVWAAGALTVVALGRWAALATGLSLGPVLAPNVPGDIRVLGAPDALVIAQGFLILAPSWDRGGDRRDRIWAAILLGAVLLLLHRTVWVATLGAILVLFWRRPALGRRFGIGLVLIGILTVLSATTLLPADPGRLETRATNTATFGWRLEGWNGLLLEQEPESRVEWAVGRPFGSGYTRMVNTIVRDESPHSTYVEGLLRIGGLGVAILIGLAVASLWALLRRPPLRGARLLTNDVLLCLTVFSLVYGITYGPQVTTIMALGLAANLGLCAHRRDEPDRAPSGDARHASRDAVPVGPMG